MSKNGPTLVVDQLLTRSRAEIGFAADSYAEALEHMGATDEYISTAELHLSGLGSDLRNEDIRESTPVLLDAAKYDEPLNRITLYPTKIAKRVAPKGYYKLPEECLLTGQDSLNAASNHLLLRLSGHLVQASQKVGVERTRHLDRAQRDVNKLRRTQGWSGIGGAYVGSVIMPHLINIEPAIDGLISAGVASVAATTAIIMRQSNNAESRATYEYFWQESLTAATMA